MQILRSTDSILYLRASGFTYPCRLSARHWRHRNRLVRHSTCPAANTATRCGTETRIFCTNPFPSSWWSSPPGAALSARRWPRICIVAASLWPCLSALQVRTNGEWVKKKLSINIRPGVADGWMAANIETFRSVTPRRNDELRNE